MTQTVMYLMDITAILNFVTNLVRRISGCADKVFLVQGEILYRSKPAAWFHPKIPLDHFFCPFGT
jgi:hypothetical protein